MRCWTTKSGQKVYEILNGRCNSFLISNGDKYLLIDTGRKNKWKQLKNELDKIGVNESSLKALILTHTHFDHAESSYSIKENYKTKLIVHKSEGDLVKYGNNPVIRGTNPITGFITGMLGEKLREFYKYKPAGYDIAVDDNFNLVELGFNAYIIHTPGHSSGSISVIIDNEIAIVGDAMFGVFKGSVFPPYAEDTAAMVSSWKKLLDTGCSLFIPAHGTENNKELLQKEYIKYKDKYNL
ncbi:MBL fold metallo-hydrolase [Clostridium sp. DJ247]|uniref:MBL fold metallo-hydrolase n=1 Tax=Clostridium sp. DJ247 TaxID=2726188 RepID=UPI0016252A59|nr:MBL fold metallo-hydrolase [Clostridium sp. DJ247]MBC2582265.1 MBL fold metallo-hydrolase [Clostridium sp. DJ247]